jgi:hypothetical protein
MIYTVHRVSSEDKQCMLEALGGKWDFYSEFLPENLKGKHTLKDLVIEGRISLIPP